MKRLPLLIAVLAILAGAIPLYHWIAASDATTMAGGSHEAHALHGEAPRPEEGGQSAFAAIAEIVALLEEDPDTDWSTVDITALREHLVDMNSLMLNANATTTVEGNTIRFRVEGEERSAAGHPGNWSPPMLLNSTSPVRGARRRRSHPKAQSFW